MYLITKQHGRLWYSALRLPCKNRELGSRFCAPFGIPCRLTCCAGEAAAHSAASAAGTLDCGGTSPSACPAGSWPVGWRVGTGAAAAAGGPRGRSPAPSWSCSDNESSTCGHKGCPWVWWGAADKCGRLVHRPPHPGTRTDGFRGLRAAGHTPYRPVPTTGQQSCCCCCCCWKL